MNKSELVNAFVSETNWSKGEAEVAVATLVNLISDTVASGEKVSLPGFGTFERRERPARTGRNPATGEEIKIAKTKAPAFKAGTTFKKYVAMSQKDQKAFRAAR